MNTRKFMLCTLLAVLCLPLTAQENIPYKHSVGGYAGNLIGGSYKTFLNEHLVLEGELGFRLGTPVTVFRMNGKRAAWFNLYTFEANPNLMYEGRIADWQFGTFHWFAGGGVSLGVGFWDGTGSACKLGLNAIGGVELAFRTIPLTCQFDFRPGYGQLVGAVTTAYFDYAVGVSARYILP